MTGTWLVWTCILLTPVIIAIGQVLFKMTGMRIEARGGSSLTQFLFDPYFVAALALYGLGTLLWVYVLRHMTLSQAYPFMAISYVLVPVASIYFFHEVLTPRYWMGLGLVIGGMLVINT
jgi:undecaprenyl phosphate-alpha-L-ara4N flippase subunit ArnE